MTDRQTVTRSDDRTSPAAEGAAGRKLDLSLTQVAGGALAAMTTAALGSRLGVAGTITGAALASVIAAVAGALYTASLRTTGERVTRVVSGTTRRRRVAATAEPELSAPQPAATPKAGVLTRLPRGWLLRMAVGAVAVFGLAAVLLTGYEAIAGQALSGGSGTTVSQVSTGGGSGGHAGTDEDDVDTEQQQDEASPSPEPSDDSGSDPSTESGPTEEPAPSEAPTQTQEPTEEPAPQPSSRATTGTGGEQGPADEPTTPSDSGGTP